MPTYHFNVHDRAGVVTDTEGQALANLLCARNQAVATARALICDDILGGILDLTGFIEVTDERQRVVLILHYEEAVLRVISP